MYISGDYFLIKLIVILLPALIILVFTILILAMLLKRHSLAIKRLYQMNFHGVEIERKRIANDLHDQVGASLQQVKSSIQAALENLNKEIAISELNNAKLVVSELHLELRQLVENIYPKDLLESNWKNSLRNLADTMSNSQQSVTIEIDVNIDLSISKLHQMFRIIQEKLTNIFSHANAKRVIIQIYENHGYVVIHFSYLKNQQSVYWLTMNFWQRNGRGSFVIHERLRILQANQSKLIENGYIHEIIKFKP